MMLTTSPPPQPRSSLSLLDVQNLKVVVCLFYVKPRNPRDDLRRDQLSSISLSFGATRSRHANFTKRTKIKSRLSDSFGKVPTVFKSASYKRVAVSSQSHASVAKANKELLVM